MTFASSLQLSGIRAYHLRHDPHVPVPAEKAVAEFIASRMRQLFPTSKAKKKLPGEFSLQQIANELGVTKPQVSDALKSAEGIGQKFEAQFAAKYYKGSVDQLRREALAWASVQPDDAVEEAVIVEPIPPPAKVVSNPWTRRDMAASFTRASGDIPDEIIEAVHARCTDPKHHSWTQIRWTDEYSKEFKRSRRTEDWQHELRETAEAKAKANASKAKPKKSAKAQPTIQTEKKPKSTRRTGT